jgi:predicted phosphodiesterase
MRALILSDIHANLEALNAVLAAAGEWDALWNLGDMVGYGASPNQVLDVIRPLATLTVRGNHDRVCCGLSSALNFNPTARAAAKWTLAKLTPDNLEWLRALPQGPLETEAPTADSKAMRVTLAHGSPLNEDQYIHTMRDAWAPLQQSTAPLTFFGHTHVQGGFSQKQQDWLELRPRFAGRTDAESPGPAHSAGDALPHQSRRGRPAPRLRLARRLRHLLERRRRGGLPPRALRPPPRAGTHPDGASARAPRRPPPRRTIGQQVQSTKVLVIVLHVAVSLFALWWNKQAHSFPV